MNRGTVRELCLLDRHTVVIAERLPLALLAGFGGRLLFDDTCDIVVIVIVILYQT